MFFIFESIGTIIKLINPLKNFAISAIAIGKAINQLPAFMLETRERIAKIELELNQLKTDDDKSRQKINHSEFSFDKKTPALFRTEAYKLPLAY